MYQYRETMDKLIQKEVEEGRVNGASALVLHRGEEIYHNVFGYADKEKNRPMKRDTIIRLFSMTKPITAAAVMILAERGEIDLWDSVSKYLPCFAGQQVLTQQGKLVRTERDSTIWDMLHMTSGIPYPNPNNESGRRLTDLFDELIARREQGEIVDTQEYLRRIAQIPLVFQPGEKWMYGLSADVLGGVIEVVSGMRFGEFLRKEIFEPLGMKDTGFFVPEEKRERFAQIYEWNETSGKLEVFTKSHLGEYYGADVAFESGGAGLVSTLDDYSRFASMLAHKGNFEGRQILGRKTVEFMIGNHLTGEQMGEAWDSLRGYGYGCLMRVLTDQGSAGSNASLGEFGWDGWTGNYVTMDIEEDLVFLYFIQRCGTGMSPAVRKLRMVTYGALQ